MKQHYNVLIKGDGIVAERIIVFATRYKNGVFEGIVDCQPVLCGLKYNDKIYFEPAQAELLNAVANDNYNY